MQQRIIRRKATERVVALHIGKHEIPVLSYANGYRVRALKQFFN